ncbi:MAG: cation:proton antiporter [Actinobacteria bacterium]|nr:MAG: cation:proton antiporter [Actinomycetota bacterium]
MNVWLAAALVLLGAMVPLVAVCILVRRAIDAVVALDLAGTNAALVLLLLSEGLKRQPFADLALVFALLSFIGTIAFSYFLEGEM